MVYVNLPELGEGIERATIAVWHVQEGECVHADTDVVEVVTDKATFNVPAGCEGLLKEILALEGQDVKIGGALAVIEPVEENKKDRKRT
jgi:pyruvate/2-oxoglutarate dehydrogenase complex dihydrolipoamide acyltransferase (E2) component